jgi:hypothetical protein
MNRDIKEILKELGDEDVPADVHKIAEETSRDFSETLTPSRRHILWRDIMKSPITKLAAAAVIIIAVLAGIYYSGGSIDGASVAWAEVTSRVAQVDYVHCYYFKSRGNDFIKHFEGWYDYGELVLRGVKGSMTYDDGQTQQTFDEHGRRIVKRTSLFAEGQTFFELFSLGLLSDKNEQFNQQTPINVGDDFLIYRLDPSPDESDWIESIFITVGKNSLLPVQVKVYHKDLDYDLIMFDYEALQKPLGFFEPPAVGSPNGSGEVLLDGEEVMIDIAGAPGLKTAIVRLRSKSFDDSSEPTFSLDVTFITEEGYRSGTNDIIRLKVGETMKCGTGSESGGLDNWPDGKYRNVKFSPLLKPTDREDTYIVEILCWLRPKED